MRKTCWMCLAAATLACGGPESQPTDQGPAAASSWVPPPGIPAPAFGIRERAGAATHVVDNSHPSATDDDNPRGTAAKPRRTIPSILPAGTVVEVRGGPYSASRHRWTAEGTAASPVFVRGVGMPLLGGGELRIEGAYVVVEGLTLEGLRVQMGPGSHIALRSSEVRGYDPGRNSAAVSMEGSDLVLHDSHVHHNGNPAGSEEEDVHGVKPDSGDSRVWIVDNHIHHNGGDAIQVGSARADEPWAQHVYIGRNHLHDDRENGVDIKQSRDVIVSENRIHSYRPSSSSSGEGIVVHDDPQRVWVVNNEISAAARGVACTGAEGFFVIGNVIHGIRHAGGGYDPDSLYGTQAILAYGSPELHAVSNTLYDVDGGISFPTGQRAVIVNNVIAGLRQPSHHVAVGGGAVSSSLMSHNLLAGSVRIKWGSTRSQGLAEFQGSSGRCAGCVAAEPGLQDPAQGDFRLRADSRATDAGVAPDAYATFLRLYGLDIARDRASTPRPQGRAMDIGAYEHRP